MQTTEIRRLQDDLKSPKDGRTLTPTNEFSSKDISTYHYYDKHLLEM